jgi:Carboxypeptidase regulatory-like domain
MRRLPDERSLLSRAIAILIAAAFLFVLPIAPAFAAGGQVGSLGGTVLDAATRAPVAGATVSAVSPSASYTATTDARGFFSFIGMTVDTYTVTITDKAAGYDPLSIPGVSLVGDQSVNMGNISYSKHLKVIANTNARSAGGAFQPSQTIDSYTITSAQIVQTTGKAFSTNENSLLLAVPGVTLTDAGMVTIRGGAAYEVGYQYDGVTFKEPFLGTNGSGGLMAGVGSVQVVAGAGDATQGGVGSGVINVVPLRGSGPGTLNLDLEAGAPNFNHQFGANWSYASPNDQFSDYISYVGSRFAPYNGYHTTPLAPYGNYFGFSYDQNDQFTNNFVFKFGNNHNQSLQVLYTNILNEGQTTGGPGGLFCNQSLNAGVPCAPGTNSNALAYYPYDTLNFAEPLVGLGGANWLAFTGLIGPAWSNSDYGKLIGLMPGTPTSNVPVPGPQVASVLTTRFLKFEYDWHINPSTFFSMKYYNWDQQLTGDGSYTSVGAAGAGITNPAMSTVGGQTTGFNGDITHQFSSNLTVSLDAKEDVLHPQFDAYEPNLGILGFAISGLAHNPQGSDFLPGGYLCGGGANGVPVGPDYMNCAAAGSVSSQRLPSWGIGYNNTFFQNWGVGIRFQYSATDKLKFDLGVRDEGQNQHWFNQLTQYNQGPPANINPFDVNPPSWNTAVLYPHVVQPRASFAYAIDRDDAVRFSYGRSAVFANAQTAGTPFELQGNLTKFLNIPAKAGATCGNVSVKVFNCPSYGAQLYWEGDNVEAPDAGNGFPAIYTNYDVSFSHAFKNGWGVRLTPFEKIGSNLPSFIDLNPKIGIFAVSNQGYNKTNGVELNVTTPTHALGFSGFMSLTYQNVLGTTPPLTSGQDTVPTLSTSTLALGDLYRAGYVSPFSIRIGGVDNLKNGFSVSPQLQYNIGYPFSIGNLIAAGFGPGNTCPCANIPQINFGPGQQVIPGIGGLTGSPVATNFFDPAYPGTSFKPNINATRGTPSTPVNGGILSTANLLADLTVQYTKRNNTIGIQMTNLFGNAYNGSVPAINPYYQAVANGVSGPQTGYNTCVAQVGGARGCTAFLPKDTYAYQNGAYLLSNGNFNSASPALAPLVPFNVRVFFQTKL